MNLVLRCRCGQRIGMDHLLQVSYYPRSLGPNLVYLRYQCPRCDKRGEQLIRQQEWDRFFLKASLATELTLEEKKQLASLGPITEEEKTQVREELERGNPLQALREWFKKEKKL